MRARQTSRASRRLVWSGLVCRNECRDLLQRLKRRLLPLLLQGKVSCPLAFFCSAGQQGQAASAHVSQALAARHAHGARLGRRVCAALHSQFRHFRRCPQDARALQRRDVCPKGMEVARHQGRVCGNSAGLSPAPLCPPSQASVLLASADAEEMVARALHVIVATLGLARHYPGLSQ